MYHIVHICREINIFKFETEYEYSREGCRLLMQNYVGLSVGHREQRQQSVVECNRYNKGTFHCFVQTHICK